MTAFNVVLYKHLQLIMKATATMKADDKLLEQVSEDCIRSGWVTVAPADCKEVGGRGRGHVLCSARYKRAVSKPWKWAGVSLDWQLCSREMEAAESKKWSMSFWVNSHLGNIPSQQQEWEISWRTAGLWSYAVYHVEWKIYWSCCLNLLQYKCLELECILIWVKLVNAFKFQHLRLGWNYLHMWPNTPCLPHDLAESRVCCICFAIKLQHFLWKTHNIASWENSFLHVDVQPNYGS